MTDTAAKNNDKPMTIEKLAEIIAQLKDMPEPEWILISPDGILYKGTADRITPIIAKHTSLLKTAFIKPMEIK